MATYRIGDDRFNSDTAEFDTAVESAYLRRERPRCLCLPPDGVEMYVAKVAGRHIVKRMPNTGAQHAPGCDSYEPPAELSGLGQVLGTAIEENVDDGFTALKLGFSLSKGGSRSAPSSPSSESDSVKTDGNKLTLRGALHYLWEQAGFNRWMPGMEGKRSWYVIRKFLLRAAQDKRAKGQDLLQMLYIPEPFKQEDKDGIAQRRQVQFAKIAGAHKAGRRLNLVIGEVKEISETRFGHKVLLKHVPDIWFMVNEDMHRRLQKRFSTELGLWDAAEDVHLVIIGTFGVGVTGIPSLEEVALMTVNAHWIPIETLYDKNLVDQLVAGRRKFVKGLRYNLPSSRPLAAAVLADTAPQATALYVVPPGAEEVYADATEGLIAQSELASWLWKAGDQQQPPLPPAAGPANAPRAASNPPPKPAPKPSTAPTAAPAAPPPSTPEPQPPTPRAGQQAVLEGIPAAQLRPERRAADL